MLEAVVPDVVPKGMGVGVARKCPLSLRFAGLSILGGRHLLSLPRLFTRFTARRSLHGAQFSSYSCLPQ